MNLINKLRNYMHANATINANKYLSNAVAMNIIHRTAINAIQAGMANLSDFKRQCISSNNNYTDMLIMLMNTLEEYGYTKGSNKEVPNYNSRDVLITIKPY